MKKTLLLIVAALASVAVTQADVITLVTTRVGTDTVNWTQLGPDNTTIPNPFAATSGGGIGIAGSFGGSGTGETSVEGSSWFGNFTIGDELGWTNSSSSDLRSRRRPAAESASPAASAAVALARHPWKARVGSAISRLAMSWFGPIPPARVRLPSG